MNVVVGSAFRNAAGRQISRWFSQLVALRLELREHYYCSLRAIAVEGDSTDDTAGELHDYSTRSADIPVQLVTCNHGGPVYGSTEHPERMVALSKVGNAIFDSVRESDDVLVYVESDLIWDAETIRRLIDRVCRHVTVDTTDGFGEPFNDMPNLVWSPVVMAGDIFYDCWAVRRLDGSRVFHPFPFTQPTELSSTGSCLVMPAAVARDKRMRMVDGALVEWCQKARECGYRVAIDPSLVVRHPT